MTYRVTWHSHWTVPEVYGELTKAEAEELVREGVDRQYRVEVIEENSVEYHVPTPAHYVPTGLSGICTDGKFW
jgi:hypothetical protein